MILHDYQPDAFSGVDPTGKLWCVCEAAQDDHLTVNGVEKLVIAHRHGRVVDLLLSADKRFALKLLAEAAQRITHNDLQLIAKAITRAEAV